MQLKKDLVFLIHNFQRSVKELNEKKRRRNILPEVIIHYTGDCGYLGWGVILICEKYIYSPKQSNY